MTETGLEILNRTLRIFGAEVSRWPEHLQQPAREALLADPEFRRAWEQERSLDRSLANHREVVDLEIARSGAAAHIAAQLSRHADPLGGIGWRSVAAAVLVAGLLGSALDLALMDQATESAEAVMLDPLEALDGADG